MTMSINSGTFPVDFFIFGEIDHRSRSILETDVFDVKALDKVKSILLQSMS